MARAAARRRPSNSTNRRAAGAARAVAIHATPPLKEKIVGQDLRNYTPDDETYWASTGKAIANRNLWISIPSLLCGFAVWLYWGIITVQMINLGYPFETSQLFTLTAIAGLSGATLRIPATFFIRIAGGRNTIFFTTALLMIPALGTGMALQNPDTPLWQYQVLALLSGIGGGNFAASMSNISFFFPKKIQGYSLGMNAGLGNFGVTTMQIVIPLVMTFGLFSGASRTLVNTSGTLIGKIPAGTETYIQNAGLVWLLLLVPLAFLGWFGMNNIRDEHVSPNIPNPFGAFSIITFMYGIGLVAALFGLWLMLPETVGGSGFGVSKWFVLPIVIALTVGLLRIIPGQIGQNLSRQYKIFGNKHTWAMTVIYTMTFGSFIGYSAAMGLTIKVVFGFQHLMVDGVLTHDTANPNGPSALMYAWMGPFIGALIRPLGGIWADKAGGAKVTQIISVVMVICAVALAWILQQAYASATPETLFLPFLGIFLILFAATGIGNGSTFRTIAVAFNKEQAGPVLGWTSAVAAYGAFLIPQIFGEQMKAGTPEYALYGFAIFYGVCIAINWWFYLRPGAYVKNP
ncbi:MFS transporter [uncultured Hoeflea sp.]|uniref:MFS transporter n=1 Tax=uncultured Hoeflea sp. TaxID=538666 RepID=UPI0026235B2C|nr:MFS transporter [uncultured Hoeflea sp.]